MSRMSKAIYATIYSPEKEKAYCQIITCDAEHCDLLKEGKCAYCDYILSPDPCPHNGFHREYGYTKRAQKYYSWKNQIKEKYKDIYLEIELNYKKLAIVGGDFVYLPYPYLDDYVNKVDESIKLKHYIPIEKFDVDMVYKIYTFKPIALMGGEIKKFQEKYVPLFLQHLKECMPDLFESFIKKYPNVSSSVEQKVQNYIGRKAYIYSLKNGSKIKDCHGYIWIKNDNHLTCEKNSTSLIPFVKIGKPTKVIIEIQNYMTYEVDDNNSVTCDTVFVD